MSRTTTQGASLEVIKMLTLAGLSLALVFVAAGCSGSDRVDGAAGTAGQGGTSGASGAAASGSGPTPTGGSAFAGTSSSAGTSGTGGTSATGGAAPTGGTAANGGTASMGGQAGSGGAGSGGIGAGGGAATASCTPARPHAPGNSTLNLQSGGKSRSYLLHVPPGYDGTKPLPLVFDIHGYSSFASEQRTRSKWDQMADKEGFILINPDGVNKSWNAGSCCGGNGEGDVKFFRDMVSDATADLCIDPKRVYVSGHSNGGAMTYRLACEAADLFAAVAPVCGWMTIDNCSPARAVPLMAIRSQNDGVVKIETADADIDEWLSNDTCVEDQVTTSGLCKTYESCKSGTQVMDCRPRGNHDFYYGSNPDNFLVPDNAWPFFKQFSLP